MKCEMGMAWRCRKREPDCLRQAVQRQVADCINVSRVCKGDALLVRMERWKDEKVG